jgi:hypothetical protein
MMVLHSWYSTHEKVKIFLPSESHPYISKHRRGSGTYCCTVSIDKIFILWIAFHKQRHFNWGVWYLYLHHIWGLYPGLEIRRDLWIILGGRTVLWWAKNVFHSKKL